jgi:hypothetical protein
LVPMVGLGQLTIASGPLDEALSGFVAVEL